MAALLKPKKWLATPCSKKGHVMPQSTSVLSSEFISQSIPSQHYFGDHLVIEAPDSPLDDVLLLRVGDKIDFASFGRDPNCDPLNRL